MFEYSQLTTADNVVSAGVVTANANFPVFGNGVFRITAAGTVAIQIRTEVAASGVSIRPDSTLLLKKIG
jgi:regulator of RNase E activity RraA